MLWRCGSDDGRTPAVPVGTSLKLRRRRDDQILLEDAASEREGRRQPLETEPVWYCDAGKAGDVGCRAKRLRPHAGWKWLTRPRLVERFSNWERHRAARWRHHRVVARKYFVECARHGAAQPDRLQIVLRKHGGTCIASVPVFRRREQLRTPAFQQILERARSLGVDDDSCGRAVGMIGELHIGDELGEVADHSE